MKQFVILLLFSLMLLSSRANVTVNAHINGLRAGTWVYCIPYRQSQQFSSVTDSVKTVANGFHFTLNIPESKGNAFLLRIGKEAAIGNSLFIFLDKGTVTISGSGPYFKKAVVSGTAAVTDYNAYTNFIATNPQWREAEALYAKAYQLQASGNYNSLDALQPELDKIDSLKKTLALQWLNRHPNSAISADIISYEFANRTGWDEIETMLNKLSAQAKNNIPAKELLHSIQVDKQTGIGRMAPLFTLPDTLGKPVSLKDFQGRYVLVDFWASWCGPCRAENPNVMKAYNDYESKNFTVLSVSLDDYKDNWLSAVHADKLPWTHVSDLTGFNSVAAKEYGVNAIPTNFLVDPSGKIIAKNLRGEDLENTLADVFKNK